MIGNSNRSGRRTVMKDGEHPDIASKAWVGGFYGMVQANQTTACVKCTISYAMVMTKTM
jgi:hypothetical protein